MYLLWVMEELLIMSQGKSCKVPSAPLAALDERLAAGSSTQCGAKQWPSLVALGEFSRAHPSVAARLTGWLSCAGKGMHSRLYRRVLNQYEWVHNCTAFSSLYNNSGLVGVFISTERSRSGQAFDIITKELQVRCHLASNS